MRNSIDRSLHFCAISIAHLLSRKVNLVVMTPESFSNCSRLKQWISNVGPFVVIRPPFYFQFSFPFDSRRFLGDCARITIYHDYRLKIQDDSLSDEIFIHNLCGYSLINQLISIESLSCKRAQHFSSTCARASLALPFATSNQFFMAHKFFEDTIM